MMVSRAAGLDWLVVRSPTANRSFVLSSSFSLPHTPFVSHDSTGPFISVLLSRLENLLENSIAVNLLVTGILAQLASYPQPLLRSFLLNTETNNQPNVRTLYQVTDTRRHRHMHTHTSLI